jgi:hypothetical protein
MKTPYLDLVIETLTKYADDEKKLIEYKAIKQLIENNPIVSTPDKPVWVFDEDGNKRILLADLGEKALNGRYILVSQKSEKYFFNNDNFNWFYSKIATPYTPKVNIEVTEDEAVKVEEFLKTLRK